MLHVAHPNEESARALSCGASGRGPFRLHRQAESFNRPVCPAIQTIVIADALMGIDNVLAVAGAAQGSVLVFGLLISVPIMIWCSQLILKYAERYPIITYFGAGVLAWTAVKMVFSEPLLAPHMPNGGLASVLVYLAVIAGTLIAGFVANQRDIGKRINASVSSLLD